MNAKQLEIKNNPDWLERVQSTRHITEETLKDVGVPLRYCDIEARKERNNPFTNVLLLSKEGCKKQQQAKEVMVDFVFAAMNNSLPGVSILVISFSELCRALTDRSHLPHVKELKDKAHRIDCLFIYDFGLFFLRDWEMTAVGHLFMHRYNSMKHIALSTENMNQHHISKHVGPVVWQVATSYCSCIETS